MPCSWSCYVKDPSGPGRCSGNSMCACAASSLGKEVVESDTLTLLWDGRGQTVRDLLAVWLLQTGRGARVCR